MSLPGWFPRRGLRFVGRPLIGNGNENERDDLDSCKTIVPSICTSEARVKYDGTDKAGDIRWDHTIIGFSVSRHKESKQGTYRLVEIALHEAQREGTLANTTGAQDHRTEFASMVIVVIMRAHRGSDRLIWQNTNTSAAHSSSSGRL